MKIRNCVFVGNLFCKTGSNAQQEPNHPNGNHVLDIVSECLNESGIKLITIDDNVGEKEEWRKFEELELADLIALDVGSGNDPILSAIMGWGYGIGKNIVVFVACGKSDGMKNLPFVRERNIIEYDERDFQSLLSANQQFKDQIQVFKDGTDPISLRSMDEKLTKILSQMNRLGGNGNGTGIGMTDENSYDKLFKQFGSLSSAFNYALEMEDVGFGEYLMPKLERSQSREKFIDLVVEQMAIMGSEKAGKILEQELESLDLDTLSLTAKAKVEAIGCYVTYCNRRDMECDRIKFVTSVIPKVIAAIEGDSLLNDDEKKKLRAQLYNQGQRLFYGAAATLENNGDKESAEFYYKKAVEAIDETIKLDPEEPAYHYNRAGNLRALEQIDDAIESIAKCMVLEDRNNSFDYYHVRLAYQLYSMRYKKQADAQDQEHRDRYAGKMKQLNLRQAITDIEEI